MNEINDIIYSHSKKSLADGFSLSVDDLPKDEIKNIITILMANDAAFKEQTLHYIDSIIQENISEIETDVRHEQGFRSVRDNQTGENQWMK